MLIALMAGLPMKIPRHFVREFRRSVNPPYGINDFPVLLGLTITLALIMLTAILMGQPRDKKSFASAVEQEIGKEEFLSNEILVKLKKPASDKIKSATRPNRVGVRSIERINEELEVEGFERVIPEKKNESKKDEVLDWYKVEIPGKKTKIKGDFDEETAKIKSTHPASVKLQEAIDHFNADPNVESVEPNFVVKILLTPNDPYYSSSGSWGQSYRDLWGMPKIDAASAWDQNTGSTSIIVADIDTGVDRNHPDIAANMWVNSGETPNNGIDDDGNGYIDDYYGWDWVNNDGDPMDDHGHGTHVAGTIAAVGNNATGVVGVNWTSKIMALKFLSASGSGSLSNGIAALRYAADMGAKISSNSWGCACNSAAMDDAVKYEHDRGMVMVAAAGNNNGDTLDHSPSSADRAIAVAATDYLDRKASFSNWGERVDVAAPGVNILSLKAAVSPMCSASKTVGTRYCRVSGTSMAAPHVSGLAALLWANNSSLTNEEIRQIIRAGSDDLGSVGKDRDFGYGRINANGSMSLTGSRYMRPIITTPSSRTTISGSSYNVLGGVAGPRFVSYKLEVGLGRNPSSWTTVKDSTTQVSSGVLATVDTTALADGDYIFRVTATDTNSKKYQFQVHDIKIDNVRDTEPPTVSITAPSNGATVSGYTYIVASATDNEGVAKVYFYVDGVLKRIDSSSPYRYFWNSKTVSNGSHTLMARAYDPSNNIGTSPTVTVNVSNVPDNTPPSVPTGLKARIVSSTRVDVTWNASIDNVGVSGYRLYRNNALIRTIYSRSFSDRNVRAGGTYYYRIAAYDAAGNQSAKSSSVKVSISVGAPKKKLGDVNGDGSINIRDLSILLSRWKSTYAGSDLNGDGKVDIRDLSILLSRWGR